MSDTKSPGWHGTTIVGVRKGSQVVVAGDGQVSLGPTVIKGSARKVRRLSPGGNDVVVGFANPGWANHENIFGINLVTELIWQLFAAPPVAHGNSYSALGIILTDNIAI